MDFPKSDDQHAHAAHPAEGRRLLPRLHAWLATPPAHLNPKYADFYALSNYVHAMGLVAHVLFLCIFVLLKIELLAWFNVLSILAFAGSLYWSKRGLLDHALLLGGIEVAAHQGLVVACLGLDPGFQQYVLILVVGTLFFSHIPLRLRVVMAILPVCWYIVLLVYGLLIPPWQILTDSVRIAFAAGNALMFTTMLMGMAIYFQYSVAKARTHAEKMAASKALFLANMSHELRTPLNAILGFSQILNRSQNLGEQDKANLATINRSGEHLLNLINRILDMSKMEEGKLELQPAPFFVDTLLGELREMFSLVAANKGLQLSVSRTPEIPEALSGDELRLRQVLINLLNNAVKFTERGGIRVTLTLAAPLQDRRARVRFSVEDDGIGIAKAERGELFQLFSQTESGRQSRYGTGLGLALCRRFVELMGGEIQVDSTPGVGSRFTFEVDLAIPEHLPQLEARHDDETALHLADAYDPCLLVVDDNAENREVLQQLLEAWGFTVVTANDGAEAIAQWQAHQPSLIWMDLRMPVIDGFAATREIVRRSAEQTLPLPRIVAITASSLEDGKACQAEAGFAGYVGKPFREIDIRRELERLLDVRFCVQKRPAGKPQQALVDAQAAIAEALSETPVELRQALFEACELADFAAAEAAIAALAPLLPEPAVHLSRWLGEYRFDRLLEQLEAANRLKPSRGGEQ